MILQAIEGILFYGHVSWFATCLWGAGSTARWPPDGWQTVEDTESVTTAGGIECVDIACPTAFGSDLRFTFLWTAEECWEGWGFTVSVTRAK